MSKQTRRLAGFLLIVICSALEPAIADCPDFKTPENGEVNYNVPVTMHFPDASAEEMLRALFGTVGLPVVIDACAKERRGKFDVTDAPFEDTVRMICSAFDLEIEGSEQAHKITCASDPEKPLAPREDTVAVFRPSDIRLQFTVYRQQTGEAEPEVISRPKLAAERGQPAEMIIGSARKPLQMADDGAIYRSTGGIEISIKVIQDPPGAADGIFQGVFRVSTSIGGTDYEANHPFRRDSAPPADTEFELAQIELPGETWILEVRSVEWDPDQ